MPLQLNWHITDACALRCLYCYKDFSQPRPDLPLEVLLRLLREARESGVARISLEGGEPLSRPDLKPLVAAIRASGIECNINTNAWSLAERIEDVRDADLLTVSLDGPEEVHDGLRGKGSFTRAVAGIQAARSNGIPVHVLSVLTRRTRPAAMLGLAKRLGCLWVPASLFSCEDAGLRMTDEERRALMIELIEAKRRKEPIAWSLEALEHVRDYPKAAPMRCQAGRFFCVMQTDGDLYPCDPHLGGGGAPNAVRLGFSEAFRRLDTRGCLACDSLVCTEYHNLFSLRPSPVLNMLRVYG